MSTDVDARMDGTGNFEAWYSGPSSRSGTAAEPPQFSRRSVQQDQVRRALVAWRDAMIAQSALAVGQVEYCARNSRIIHDVFIDAIAANAESIHSAQDLRDVAFYWRWIDEYGSELFSVISRHLDRPKRSRHDEPSAKRVRCI